MEQDPKQGGEVSRPLRGENNISCVLLSVEHVGVGLCLWPLEGARDIEKGGLYLNIWKWFSRPTKLLFHEPNGESC